MSSTWFVTGASRGFGRELTEQVLARGDRVAATLRHPEQLDDLAAMIEAVLSDDPPRRLLLGSDAYGLVTGALRDRLSAFEQQKAVAFSTDFKRGEGAS